jgi:hypothetical protein
MREKEGHELQSATPAVRAIKVRLNSGSFIEIAGEIKDKSPKTPNI